MENDSLEHRCSFESLFSRFAWRCRLVATNAIGSSAMRNSSTCPEIREMFLVMEHKSSSHSPNHRFVTALHSPVANRETGPTVSPSEKRAAELAFRVQLGNFSESGFGTKRAELRPIPPISAIDLRGFSALETSWRRGGDSNSRYPYEYV